MSGDLIVISLVLVGLWLATLLVAWWLLKRWRQTELTKLVQDAFVQSAQHVSTQQQALLNSEQQRIQADLNRQSQQIEKLVGRVEQQLQQRHSEYVKSDQERIAAFASLQQQLEEQRGSIKDLSLSTGKLSQLLSNNQARGQWGEQVIEDLLKANGLVEGIHYLRQQPLTKELRPDITMLLPDKRLIAVDVKFPLSELALVTNASSKQDRSTHLVQFKQHVRLHLKKVSGYIQPSARTLDYAILFVPSEMVFSFLNQETPELLADAMRLRVLLVSPFTFLMVAGTLRESYRNFILSDSLHDAVLVLEEFAGEWEKYKSSLQKYGKAITLLASDYEDLTGVRTRQLDRKVDKLRQISTGALKQSVGVDGADVSNAELPSESMNSD